MRRKLLHSIIFFMLLFAHSAWARTSEPTVTGIPLAIIAVLGFTLLTFEITSIIIAGRKSRMSTAGTQTFSSPQTNMTIPTSSVPNSKNVTDELRTSLNSIQTCSSQLLREDLTESQREYVELIEASTRSLLSSVNALLDQSLSDSSVSTSSAPQLQPNQQTIA